MIDDVIKIIDAVKQYGIWPIIIAAGVLAILTGAGIWVKRLVEKLSSEVPPPDTKKKKKGFFAKLEARRYAEAKEKLGEVANLEPMTFKDLLLQKQMSDFLSAPFFKEHGEPSRVVLFSYHNGGHYTGGDYMSKMSLRVQVRNKNSFLGELEGNDAVRGLLRIDYPHLYEMLLRQGRFYISNVQTIRDDDPHLYNFLIRSNINAAYFRQLNDSDGTPLGFLLVGYNEAPKNEKYVVDQIVIFAASLSGILALNLVELNKLFQEARIQPGKPED